MNQNNNGKMIISLDYELMWGVRDKRTKENYGDAIANVKKATYQTLELFDQFQISATFATVGFLFHENKEQLINYAPEIKPTYNDKNLSPYPKISNYLGDNETEDPYYFGYQLIQRIKNNPLHELATHTYCHYYCLEPGQNEEQFEADLKKALEVAKEKDVKIHSIVFPRNQYSEANLRICKEFGITSYRGNESHYIYTTGNVENQTPLRRALRLLDSYINITGYHCYSSKFVKESSPCNIPSSRFLRPYQKTLSFLEDLKMSRIKRSMTYAAKNNLIYHLWWHPHNFGRNTEENLKNLKSILEHYKYLSEKYNFESLTMKKLTDKI